jgi:hypothetical protein
LCPIFDREGLIDDRIIGEPLPVRPDKFAGSVHQLLAFKIHSKRRKRLFLNDLIISSDGRVLVVQRFRNHKPSSKSLGMLSV